MRRAFSLFLALSVLSSSAAFGKESADRTLTLEDSVRLAVNNSQILLNAREDSNIALQRVREAESLFFPKLDLNANWSKFRVQDDVPILLQPSLGPTLIGSSPRQNFYTARANIYQPVYEGGRLRNTWRQARISYERARSMNASLQTQVEGAAKQAFYDLLFEQEKDRQFKELLRRFGELDKQMRDSSLGERLRLEQGAEEVHEEAAEASRGAQQALLTYLRTLNLELTTLVQLKGALVTHPVELDLQKLLAWSSQYRAELRQTEYQQELDALGISLSQAERTPTVGFGASYERTGFDLGIPTANWAGTLNINLPVSISDIAYGFAKVRERKAQYRQATLKHADTTDQIELQVRQAYTDYRFWQGELPQREEALHRIERLVGTEGPRRGSPAEQALGSRLLVECRLRYLEAIHGHLSALAALEKAVGHSLASEVGENE
jgi:outer membrane protein TolC